MKLLDYLKKEAIVPELTARRKKEVLEELCQAASLVSGLDKGPLLDVLLEREKLGSTGIGEGVAIPHGKSKVVRDLLLACGRSRTGVDFEALDGKPTHLFFLLLAPEDSAGMHLKALAKVSRLLKDSSFRQEFLAAGNAREMYELIDSRDSDF
ncbi:MAG: PTS sugar transporter subunit IIA [Thermodesulfobacteriota bacterium]